MNRFPVENIDKVAEAELADNATTAQTANKANQLSNAKTVQVNLASTSSVNFDGSSNITPGITGTLPIVNGGTGLTASPSMLVNLASTTADTILEASPRPGITGVLNVANGGTGSSTKNFVDLTSTQTIAGNKTFSGTTSCATLNVTTTLTIPGGQIWIA